MKNQKNSSLRENSYAQTNRLSNETDMKAGKRCWGGERGKRPAARNCQGEGVQATFKASLNFRYADALLPQTTLNWAQEKKEPIRNRTVSEGVAGKKG